jgi:hypothetical protein
MCTSMLNDLAKMMRSAGRYGLINRGRLGRQGLIIMDLEEIFAAEVFAAEADAAWTGIDVRDLVAAALADLWTSGTAEGWDRDQIQALADRYTTDGLPRPFDRSNVVSIERRRRERGRNGY